MRMSGEAIARELAARLRAPGRALVRGRGRQALLALGELERAAMAAATAGSSGSGVISSSRTAVAYS